MSATLQREHWNNQPTPLGELFHVTKMRGDKQLEAAARLWPHQIGWVRRCPAQEAGRMPAVEITRADGSVVLLEFSNSIIDAGGSAALHTAAPRAEGPHRA
jgi:hypothetical protein